VIAMRSDTERGARRQRELDAPAPVPAEHLRDQVFAACGYAVALAVPATWLLAPYLGSSGLPTVLALAVLMVPLNLVGIRRFARACRSRGARQSVEADRARPR